MSKPIHNATNAQTRFTIDQFQIGTYKNFTYLLTAHTQSCVESLVVDPQTDLSSWKKRSTNIKVHSKASSLHILIGTILSASIK